MPKVTCVLPTYNNITFLAKSINSLIKQTLKDIEIIIIDDCSTDNSADLVRFYQSKYKRIKLIILEERKGAAYCRNLGNSLAKSDVILVCDSGDINHKNRAKDAYKFFKKYKNISIYSTTCIEINSLDENINVNFPRMFDPSEKPSIFHPTVAYRKSVTDEIKYREGNLATDQYEAFLFEAHNAGFKFWHTTECMVKKLTLPESYGSSLLRHEQRRKNFEEFGIKF